MSKERKKKLRETKMAVPRPLSVLLLVLAVVVVAGEFARGEKEKRN